MKVHYRCLYLPQSKKPEGGRPEPYWKTYHYTMAVKNGTLGDRSRFTVKNDNGQELMISKANAHLCRDDFAAWLGQTIKSELRDAPVLVAVPSKDALVGARPPIRSLALVQHVEAKTGLIAVDALRWTEQLQKSAQGGTRNADHLYDKMQVIVRATKSSVVLVDDVFTSGAHMKAARKRLVDAGFTVACGVVCGKSIDLPQMIDGPFAPGTVEMGESLNPFADLFGPIEDAT